jgi:hypothetical protein
MAAFRSRIEFWAQAAGLFATAWLVWAIAIAPYRGSRAYVLDRIGWASWIAFCALSWSAFLAVSIWLVSRHLAGEEEPPATVGPASMAVWFAPATILVLQFSVTGLTAGLVLAVSAARLLCAPSRTPEVWSIPWRARVLTEIEAPVDLLSRHRTPALLASAGFQLASIALLTGHPLPAAALLVMTAALLTSVAIGIGAWVEDRPPNLPRSVLGLGLTFLLALMIGSGSGGSGWGFGFGSGTGVGEIAKRLGAGSKAEQDDRPERAAPETNLPGNYSGVIIWPEIRPVTVLVPPLPASGGGFARQSQPLTIPFGGEYWMFRWPYRRPPQNSYFRRGTPSALSFKTPDHFPMQMEARQKLEQAISSRCCSRLQMAILNADPFPKTISLELILIDGNIERWNRLHPGQPKTAQESLGRASVTSLPQQKAAASEMLDFPFPSAPRLNQFDEIKVIFHRADGRMDRSARVSIERFVLVPPG